MSLNKTISTYEVLSPWAEADPIAWKGINKRLTDLVGKKIGLLRNSKRTAEPTLRVVEERLKKRYPSVSFNWFANLKPNEAAVEYAIKEDFEKWIEGVDAIIASYGD